MADADEDWLVEDSGGGRDRSRETSIDGREGEVDEVWDSEGLGARRRLEPREVPEVSGWDEAGVDEEAEPSTSEGSRHIATIASFPFTTQTPLPLRKRFDKRHGQRTRDESQPPTLLGHTFPHPLHVSFSARTQ